MLMMMTTTDDEYRSRTKLDVCRCAVADTKVTVCHVIRADKPPPQPRTFNISIRMPPPARLQPATMSDPLTYASVLLQLFRLCRIPLLHDYSISPVVVDPVQWHVCGRLITALHTDPAVVVQRQDVDDADHQHHQSDSVLTLDERIAMIRALTELCPGWWLLVDDDEPAVIARNIAFHVEQVYSFISMASARSNRLQRIVSTCLQTGDYTRMAKQFKTGSLFPVAILVLIHASIS